MLDLYVIVTSHIYNYIYMFGQARTQNFFQIFMKAWGGGGGGGGELKKNLNFFLILFLTVKKKKF